MTQSTAFEVSEQKKKEEGLYAKTITKAQKKGASFYYERNK